MVVQCTRYSLCSAVGRVLAFPTRSMQDFVSSRYLQYKSFFRSRQDWNCVEYHRSVAEER